MNKNLITKYSSDFLTMITIFLISFWVFSKIENLLLAFIFSFFLTIFLSSYLFFFWSKFGPFATQDFRRINNLFSQGLFIELILIISDSFFSGQNLFTYSGWIGILNSNKYNLEYLMTSLFGILLPLVFILAYIKIGFIYLISNILVLTYKKE